MKWLTRPFNNYGLWWQVPYCLRLAWTTPFLFPSKISKPSLWLSWIIMLKLNVSYTSLGKNNKKLKDIKQKWQNTKVSLLEDMLKCTRDYTRLQTFLDCIEGHCGAVAKGTPDLRFISSHACEFGETVYYEFSYFPWTITPTPIMNSNLDH